MEQLLNKYKIQQLSSKILAGKSESKATNWLQLFMTVYQSRYVTPYMNLLSSHMIVEIYHYFPNRDVTKFYFQSTNHYNEASLKQIVMKLYCLEVNVYGPNDYQT